MVKISKKIALIMWSEKYNSPLRIIKKSYARYKKHGRRGMIERLDKEYFKLYKNKKSIQKDKIDLYSKWIIENEKEIDKVYDLKYNPKISIITPVYNTNIKYLVDMIESVLNQTYSNWELCIADDASTDKQTLQVLKDYENKYKNIKIKYRKTNGHISAASNSALKLATGKYVIFLDHDDILSINALFEIVKKLNENMALKLIYSDEDKIDENNKRFNPHFKSAWNPDMFYSQNYICHLVCLDKKLVDDIGGFRCGYEGSQDYDLLIRYLAQIEDKNIAHIEKILYHWRAIEGSTALCVSQKSYSCDAGLKALQDYFSKNKSISVEKGLLSNTYKVNYIFSEYNPLVTLLIPSKDGYDLITRCIDSIIKKTTYKNYEIIILDNNTTCTRTLDYFENIKKYQNITILKYPYTFNYSAINNFGAKYAKGELIGLINNDIEVINDEWLGEMVSHAIRKDIGAVGAKLYYPDETIQHAGVVLGIGGVAGHSHKYFQKESNGYFSRLKIIQNYSAVTAACLIVKKDIYNEVGGLDEENLKIAFNDVDFCLKLLEKGYRNIWTPYAMLIHHESKSRGKEDTEEKIERFNKEVKYMKDKWMKYIKNDKYYNCNLTSVYEDFRVNVDE
jgi:GT2 family glycosyltransferase